MFEKDLPGWNHNKISIDNITKSPVYFKERQVWWMAVGHNVGVEINGKGDQFSRPVIILRKFNSNSFLGVPLSTVIKTGPYYFPLNVKDRDNIALISQIRVYDAKRLIKKHGSVPTNSYDELKRLIAEIVRR